MGLDAQGLSVDVYGELKVLAHRHLANERSGHTLQPTALVHEAFLNLAEQDRVSWKSRTHFLAVAATEMRRILVDYARARATQKRGHGRRRVSLEDACVLFERNEIELLDFDLVLSQFADVDPRACQVVEYRIFAGLTQVEIAELLNLSERTIREDWKFAAAWLASRLDATPRSQS